LFVLAHFAHHLLTALPVPLLPYIRDDFNLNYTKSALVTSAFSLSYGVGQLPAGWMADRLGPRSLITVGILGVAVVGTFVGFSQTYIMLIVLLIFMGLAGGGYHPSATPLISTSVETKQRGRALGFHLIGGSGSFFLAPIIAASIAAANIWGLSWRGSFIGLAVPTALFGILFYVLLGRITGPGGSGKLGGKHTTEEQPASGNVRRLVAFLILIIVSGGVNFSVNGLMSLYLSDHFKVSNQVAASMPAIINSAGLWASPLGGYLSDRIGRLPIIIVTSFLGGVLVYLLTVVPYGYTIGSVGLGIGGLLLLIGANNYIRMPVAEAYIMGQTTSRRRSTIFGIYYFAMQQAGGIFAIPVAAMADHYGFASTFTLAAAISVGITLLCTPFLFGGTDY